MELMNIEAFQAAYPRWLEQARPFLEAADWKSSFRDFPYVKNADSPWTPLKKPLAESRVAMLTTAGLYLKDDHAPFTAGDIEGDASFRELPEAASSGRLAIAHDHYPHKHVEQDLNCVYPLQRLQEMVADGVLGELAPRNFSISGYCTRIDKVVEETVPRIVERLKADRVDVLLHIPV